jgi:hypothetical protein
MLVYICSPTIEISAGLDPVHPVMLTNWWVRVCRTIGRTRLYLQMAMFINLCRFIGEHGDEPTAGIGVFVQHV